MQKFITFSILILMLFQVNYANSVTLSTKGSTDYSSTNEIYSKDLARVEKYLFGISYKGDNIVERFNRIENKLFNKTYQDLNYAQRMNNILTSYKDDYNNKHYMSEYYSSNSPSQMMRNRFMGQPTGFTPPVTPYPPYSPQYNRGYSTTQGYGSPIPQTSAGASVRILD
jgi:hypothetical protein